MAQAKGGRKPASSGGTSGKKAAETKAKQEARERYHQQLGALGMFAGGALLLAILAIKGQKVWTVLHNAMYGLFGWCAWLVPVFLVYIAVLATMDKCVIRHKLWQTGIFLALLCAATHIFGMPDWDPEGFVDGVTSLYQNGMELHGGGLCAGLAGVPLLSMLGATGAKVSIVILTFVFFMIITGTTLHQFMQSAAKPVRRVEQAYIERAEERRAIRASAPVGGPARFNIDVPVDEANLPDEEPPMPQHPVQSTNIPSYTDSFKTARTRRPELDPAYTARPSFDPASPAVLARAMAAATPAPNPPEDKLGIDEIVNKAMGLEANAFKPAYIPDEEADCGEVFTPEPLEVEFNNDNDERFHLSPDVLEKINREFVYDLPEDDDEQEEPIRGGHMVLPENVIQEDEEPLLQANEVLRQAIQNLEPVTPRFEPSLEDADDLDSIDDPDNLTAWADDEPEKPARQVQTPPSVREPLPGPAMDDEPELSAAPGAAKAALPVDVEGETSVVYRFPPVGLLHESKQDVNETVPEELKANAQLLVDTLNSFGVQTRIIDISRGPAVTRYELQPSAGVKISKITGLADDIALNLAAAGVRIEAPIPNKAAVGIEVPNKTISVVGIREIIDSDVFRNASSGLSVALGKDISGNISIADIGKMPHLLIAGATGSGKSVCINSLIVSLLYKSTPDQVRLLMIDPKVVELGIYNGIPHLLVPVVTDPRKAAGALNWAVTEMLGRYKLFADNSVRDLKGYNKLAQREDNQLQTMPEIVVIIDELADLMMAAPNEVEDAICRLAQMARAAGMHLVIATQRPSVDVITGVIKANIPSRIAFAVSSQVDSRTILDGGGAEKLLGRGDMLFMPVGASKPTRVQGCFVSDQEVEDVVAFIKGSQESEYDETIMSEIERQAVAEKGSKGGRGSNEGGGFEADDEMLEKAIEIVVEAGQASTSMLQRRLKLGYARAARLVDEMEQRGIVGPFEGSKPRSVLVSRQQWMERQMRGVAEPVEEE